jgi:acetyltransferase-like isoleucine patch superfamily enzyme
MSVVLRPAADRDLVHWPFLSEALSMVPFAFGWQLRQELYRRLAGGCGEGTIIHHGVTITDRRTAIGSDVWISSKVYVDRAEIGDHVLIGPGAALLAGRHHHRSERTDIPIKSQGNHELLPIRIGEGAWIGANATVMADVGRHAIVGAGAVVTEPVPDFAVAVGNPARVVKDRRNETRKARGGVG